MKRTLLLALCLIPFLAHGQVVKSDENEGSLVPVHFRNPLVDRTATAVGDLLTIVVNESSSATLSASTKATKQDSSSIPLLSALNIPLLGKFINAAQKGDTSSNSGTGSTQHAGTFTTKIAVIVKQVLPNGNLVIEGDRAVNVNKDLQIYKLSGIVRREDVRVDNTVLSENVANAKITTDGKGLIGDHQRRGILSRLFSWLF